MCLLLLHVFVFLCFHDVFVGMIFSSPGITFNRKRPKSLLQSCLSSINGDHYMVLNSCPVCDQSGARGLTQREVAEDEHCCQTARWDASCVYSHCAGLRGAVRCSWMQLVWNSSAWTVADMPRRRRLSEATLSQLDTSSGRVAGRQRMDKGLDSFPPCSHLTLCIVR